MIRRSTSRLLLLATLAPVVGCAQGLEVASHQSRVIASGEPDSVLRAAAALLRREFRRVTIEPERRRIVTEPVEYMTASGSGTARDLVRARSRMRRFATLSVARHGGSTVARLRIDVERQDTARRRAVRPEAYRLSDSPAYTPIERDAATTEEQNTVWTRVRRDRRLERALLSELQEQFAPPASEAEQRATPDQPADKD